MAAATAVVLWGVFLGKRQVGLGVLRAENHALRQQAEASSATTPPSVAPPTPIPAILPLTASERMELLRLRGEVQPLRDELRALTQTRPAPAKGVVQSSPPPERPPRPSNPEVREILSGPEMSASFALAQALHRHLREHEGELPEDLAVMESQGAASIPQGTAGQFEWVRRDRIPEEARSYTLVAREKSPRQLSDGAWVRIYLIANGGVALAGPSPTEDWPGWERLHEAMGREQGRRKASRE